MHANVVPGLNSNVTVNDQVLHVQTEDLGRQNSVIVTHVFSKTGQVVKVVRFDYAKHRDKTNLRSILSKALLLQHTATIQELVKGERSAHAPGIAARADPTPSAAPRVGLFARLGIAVSRRLGSLFKGA